MTRSLEEIQDELISRLHAGEGIDRAAVLAAHPAHREQLARFLDLLTHLEVVPAAQELRPATLGEFRIVRELGRGGMGVVYEAEQSSLKRRVALKVLPGDLLGNPRIAARFRREAEAAGRLRHPGIVPVYSVGEARGVPFFSMELVAGRSLAEVLRARAAGDDHGLPPAGPEWQRWVLGMVAKVADALHYAHGEEILHRDVKPANVLLEADGTPRLTDFGLALDLGAPGLTSPGESCGTPLYMSPEQALRHEVPLDRRTDVYSLGVTLYEALTLHTPYAGLSAAEVFAALREGAIVRPREVDPSIPEAWEQVILKALAPNATDRYASAAGFAADLRGLLEGRSPAPRAATETGRGVTAGGPHPRRRRLAWVAAGACLLAVGGWLLLRDPAVPSASHARSTSTPWPLVTPSDGPAWARVSPRQVEEARRLGVPVAVENAIGMRFVLIPAGTFTMGSSTSEPGHEEVEAQHPVTLTRPYYLQTTEVTWKHWRAWEPTATTGQVAGEPAGGDPQPLIRVRPSQLEAYLAWVNAREAGKVYRLPTEAEWEHACRAGTTTPWFWGDDPTEGVRYANIADGSLHRRHDEFAGLDVDDGFVIEAPVGSFPPNPWGLHDMVGNVGEWTADSFAPYGPAPQVDPLVRGGTNRICRGGAWWNPMVGQRSAQRSWPAYDEYQDVGVRLAMDVPGLAAVPRPPPVLSDAQRTEAQRLGVPAWFDNRVGMRFVLIPAGTFTMGSPVHEPGRGSDETPHEVTISRAFYLQTTETTWAQWRRWDPAAGGTVWKGLPTDGDDLPVSAVNGDQRLTGFLDWVKTQDDGRAYRLPTETEWEYACRAGTTTRWYWGEDVNDTPRYANVLGRRALVKHPELAGAFPLDGLSHPQPLPVGSFLPNPWGLHDMLGNIAEWVEDSYGPLGASPTTDPVVREEGKERGARGGAWWNDSKALRGASRGHAAWSGTTLFHDIGLRLACEIPAAAPKTSNEPRSQATPWPLEVPKDGPAWARVSRRQIEEATRLKVPVAFENPIGMRFVLIPAGEFLMGSPDTEPGHQPHETLHKVTLTKPYYLQTTELTAGQWRAWDSTYRAADHWGVPHNDDTHPATAIDHRTLETFTRWLGKRDPGRSYRLPTDAEWEHACRAGTTTTWFWGDDAREAGRYANVADRTFHARARAAPLLFDLDDGHDGPAHVASYAPNPWGLHDMVGNAFEWCADAWSPLGPEEATDPLVRIADKIPLIRGGCFHIHPHDTRSAARVECTPGFDSFVETTTRLACDVPVR